MAQAYEQQQPPQPPAAEGDDTLTQLAKLGEMKDAGLIDESEFAAAKAKLLGL